VLPCYRKNAKAGTALSAKAGRVVKVPRPVRRKTAKPFVVCSILTADAVVKAVGHLITGKVDVGKAVLRDYINATIGFARLAKACSL
jgi:hypothetical protein